MEKKLREIGLKKSEIAVYLYLIEYGQTTPPRIARGTGIARTNCYNILRSLREKGLILKQPKNKRSSYIARNPKSLLNTLERQKETIEELLPDLQALHKTQRHKPSIQFYDGFEEVKEIYDESLTAKKIIAIGSTNYMLATDSQFFTNYHKKVKKKGIVFYDILSPESRYRGIPEIKKIMRGLYDARVLPVKYKELPTDILIWDNNIALITFKKPVFGTMISSPPLAETFRIIFDVLWEKSS